MSCGNSHLPVLLTKPPQRPQERRGHGAPPFCCCLHHRGLDSCWPLLNTAASGGSSLRRRLSPARPPGPCCTLHCAGLLPHLQPSPISSAPALLLSLPACRRRCRRPCPAPLARCRAMGSPPSLPFRQVRKKRNREAEEAKPWCFLCCRGEAQRRTAVVSVPPPLASAAAHAPCPCRLPAVHVDADPYALVSHNQSPICFLFAQSLMRRPHSLHTSARSTTSERPLFTALESRARLAGTAATVAVRVRAAHAACLTQAHGSDPAQNTQPNPAAGARSAARS